MSAEEVLLGRGKATVATLADEASEERAAQPYHDEIPRTDVLRTLGGKLLRLEG